MEAFSMALMLPNLLTNAFAETGPICRIDNATNTLHNGRSLATIKPFSNLSIILLSFPSLRLKKSDFSNFSLVNSKRSPSSFTKPSARSAAAASYPRTSKSSALRPPR
jgi:hypothetical protein